MGGVEITPPRCPMARRRRRSTGQFLLCADFTKFASSHLDTPNYLIFNKSLAIPRRHPI
jgi:hypothetical protein